MNQSHCYLLNCFAKDAEGLDSVASSVVEFVSSVARQKREMLVAGAKKEKKTLLILK